MPTKTLDINCPGDEKFDITLRPSREAQVAVLTALNALFISTTVRDNFKNAFQALTGQDFDSWLYAVLASPNMTIHPIFSVRGVCCPDVDGTAITWKFQNLDPLEVSIGGVELKIYSDSQPLDPATVPCGSGNKCKRRKGVFVVQWYMVLKIDFDLGWFKSIKIKLPQTLIQIDEIIVLSPCCCPPGEKDTPTIGRTKKASATTTHEKHPGGSRS